MEANEIIIDGTAKFKVRTKNNLVRMINNITPTPDGNITITDITGNAATATHASTADNLKATGNDLGQLLWNWLHRYGENYVPSDTSNKGWNALGICIIYYNQSNKIKNQPYQYGQLINIPATFAVESMQIWINQPGGDIYTRGANGTSRPNINDEVFVKRG